MEELTNYTNIKGNVKCESLSVLNPNVADTLSITIGRTITNNDALSIRYKNNTSPHELGIGFVENEDIITIDADKNITVDGQFKTNSNGLNSIFQMIYPIGSVYVSMTPLSNISGAIRTSETTNSVITYNWHGCTFEYISDRRFLYSAGTLSTTAEGTTTYEEDITQTGIGGEAEHTHQYGIRYSGWYPEIHGYDGDNLRLYDNGSWKGPTNLNNNITQTSWYNSSDTHSMARYQALANTGSSSSLPPYQTVFMYKRIA